MNILLVDDDQDSRACVGNFLREMGHRVMECDSGRSALNLIASGDFSMVLSDIKMPGMSGIELLKNISFLPEGKKVDVVLFTGHGDMETAIEALRAGAYDYLLKPINVEELAAITERIADYQALRRENMILTKHFEDKLKAETEETRRQLSKLKETLARSMGLGNIGFFSETMQRIAEQANKYHTDRSIPVLIQGETGTGKEVIAKLIHYGESWENRPFVDINCAALTPSLFESELFGYEAGAFTGGLPKGQKGKLDLAQGGTLFLDEVAEIPLELQGKLLRVIQEKEFYRISGLKKVKVDVRIICATNVDITKRVEQGKFREDLYYRLKVGHILIPPLRDRKEDILPLANLFLQEFSKQKRKSFSRIGDAAAKILKGYHWPGNVRELRNAIEWVIFMYDETELKSEYLAILDRINPNHNREEKMEPKELNPEEFSLPEERFFLEEYMNKIVLKALKKYGGNKTKAAQYLGISRRSLYCKMKHIRFPNKNEEIEQ
ncbi:sigma-54-dependent transcriptional regulator [Desulforamulus ruminis]|uniref:Stage 0 sporulation protein A homolog n=1 Tax=Desulforamulus ruminis (strain ATCC 23193 / DSM 2154 / NCIMB 8452 / DL) TaxID=696281 RepID=F6DV26_DESRL|nr:sigma-54 dependent transcriptional regulator [Desulforamulus ruminis]AEG59092.1 sigma-54 factor interaction domain-containing protein [Desulforamulus ruminis DSM 2154]